jgi:hypothetical protein
MMSYENFERLKEIDAITCEPLHPQRHVSVAGPDGSIVLYYNTSTLVRIAKTKGLWLQQPQVLTVPLVGVNQPCQMIPIPDLDLIFTNYPRYAAI